MARATPFDPEASTVDVLYVTPTATAPAFITAYGEANQTLAEMSPQGVKVQANTLSAW